MIFRNDDVNTNTNLTRLNELYSIIKEFYPYSEIWSGVTLFSEENSRGSIYEKVPFKNQETNWFYTADRFMNRLAIPKSRIVSHGIYHVDHSKLSKDAQEMSILGSCRYLKTDVFVPPFNAFNHSTLEICQDNDIKLFGGLKGWLSMECEKFNPEHDNWYLHSWRWLPKGLRKVFDESGRLHAQSHSV